MLEVEMLARQASPMAIERLVAWAQSKDPSASPKACLALLDRAWGKPQQAIEHKRSPNLALQINIVGTPVHERPREIEVQANLVKPNGSHP